jgi:hypothetical protein
LKDLAAIGSWTDGQKNNTFLDAELCRPFESKLKGSLDYILRTLRCCNQAPLVPADSTILENTPNMQ